MSRNRFAPTGIGGIDRNIDLQLDALRDASRFEVAAAYLQGIRTALAGIDPARYAQTNYELAELIAAHDPNV